MGLRESTRLFEGKLLRFIPAYGWGWSQTDEYNRELRADYEKIERAGPFRLRVVRLFEYLGELRGVVGRIEEAGHLFDRLNAAAWNRSVGDYDFTENPDVFWDIRMGPGEPIGGEAPYTFAGSPLYVGFGRLIADDSYRAAT